MKEQVTIQVNQTKQEEPGLFYLFGQLWHQLGRRRVQLCGLLLIMLASSAAEVLSLASVLPFLAVMVRPEELWNYRIVQQLAPRFGMATPEELLFPMTIVFVLAALLAGAVRLLNLWLTGRLAAAIGSDISCEVYRRSLYQPYAVHLARNSSELISSISNDVQMVINAISSLLVMISSGLTAISLVIALMALDWLIALVAGFIVVSVYIAAMSVSRQPLHQLGRRQVQLNRQLIKALQEGLGAIREVLIDGSQSFYSKIYLLADNPLRRVGADASFLSMFPRLVIEPFGIALIAVVGLLLVRQEGVERALPLLGALALGAQRLLPMVQKLYEGWAQTRHAKGSLIAVIQLLSQPQPPSQSQVRSSPMTMRKGLSFKDVYFSYGPALNDCLLAIDLEICSGESIGIIGSTGSGKSTTVDLLMGLLLPTSGRVLVDGMDLHDPRHPDRLSSWQAAIAHVPQMIYLSDSSIAENIAFGVAKDRIDMDRVRHAASRAQIASFIESSPQGYQSFVGERGIRLSGGQRQRIGIARALYKNASVLVFDEATSALDGNTEKLLMAAVNELGDDITVVMIAHRLSTVECCDRVICLENGRVAAEGPPNVILAGRS